MNNFNKIKAMNIEEMAEFFAKVQKKIQTETIYYYGLAMMQHAENASNNIPEFTLKSSHKSYKQWLESEEILK